MAEELEGAVGYLCKRTPDPISAATSLIGVIKNLQSLVMNSCPDSEFAQKLTTYVSSLGNPFMLNARMAKNLATNPLQVTEKIAGSIMGMVKSDFTVAGPRLGELLNILTT